MFAWGSTVHGELGLGGIEDEYIFTPRSLEWYLANSVKEAACGDTHTLLLTNDGKVFSCGNNDYGQLGHDQPRKRPHPVADLDAYKITHVCCGVSHSMALNNWGQIFTWGSDINGQLGHHLGQQIQPTPKLLKALATVHIIQIACGQKHSLALTTGGEIYAWGANNYGQLGIGTLTPFEPEPQLISTLAGIPIALLACGYNHTFVISKSGAVFGWGKNTFGQLGLNSTDTKMFPTQLRTLRNVKVRYISCGDEFSTFLTLDGGVFSCGAGMYGQLGHGNVSNEILPKKILELMGSTITQIACGSRHTLAFVPSRGRVYSFGLGGAGQLGDRKPSNASTPQVVQGPWISSTSSSVTSIQASCFIYRIFAGGDHCFAMIMENNSDIPPYDLRDPDPEQQILKLNYEYLSGCLSISPSDQIDQEMLVYLETVFKSLSCINASFLLPNDAHYCCTSKHHGVDMDAAEQIFSLIGKFENESIKDLIWVSITEDLLGKLCSSPPDVETLRIYLTLPLYHEFNNPKQHYKLHRPFASALLMLQDVASKVVGGWWSCMSHEYFERLVSIFKNVVCFIIRNQKIPENKTVLYDSSLVAMLDILRFIYKLNRNADGLKVSYDTFYLPELSECLDVRVDYLLWLTDTGTNKLFLCNYPFLFDTPAKLQLLQTDQSIQMQSAMNAAAQRAVMAMLFQPNALQMINQFLVLNVTRENIVADTLRELLEVDGSDLKKPLKVKFYGEEAEDAGGVRKEFFLLLLREILDPKFGMFKQYEESRTIWFSENPFEDRLMYLLIGLICGLAIYNFTIIDLPFPLALYKKLLKESISLSDLKDLSPTLANSLKSILEYTEPDLEDVFCLNFEVSREIFGEYTMVALKPDGANIPVTLENKQEYVDLYVDYIFNTSISEQYNAFSSGFMKVCGGRVLQLFHSHELMAVIVGNENYDWHALEEVAEYRGEYTSSDVTVRWFWEVIHEMSLENKKKFLLFLTGCDRIPIQGMKDIKIIIQPTYNEKYLPVAHTCFNLLDLPRYKTKERLRYKLLQAIQQTEGFSLV